jgi:hypothetical protein
MAGITERNQQKIELVNNGFYLRYIDEWQPKTTLYRHKPSYNVEGEITGDVGTMVKGVPGSPDYVLRKSKIGLFPWPPSVGCTCRWCVKNQPEQEVPSVAESISNPPDSSQAPKAKPSPRLGPYFQQETS